jgi:hypothetical protein
VAAVQAWLKDTETGRAKHNQNWTDKMLVQYEPFQKHRKLSAQPGAGKGGGQW